MALSINKTNNRNNTFVNIIVYGASGVGKTSLVKTLPSKDTLVLSAEDGLLSLRDIEVDYVKVKSIADVMSVIKDADCDKYKNIVVDSITELSQNHFSYLKDKYPDPKMALKLWGDFTQDFQLMFKTLRGLEKNVIALALPKETENEIGKIIKRPDVYGKSSDRIIAWFDECFYMFIDKENQRQFLTQSVETVMAKDRSGLFDKHIVPDLGKILSTILS